MITNKRCDYCKNQIDTKEKFVLLSTIDPSFVEDTYFHFDCFVKNHNEKVELKARNIIMGLQKKSVDLFSTIKGMTGTFEGGDQLESLLNINLSKTTQKNNSDEVLGKKKTKKKTKEKNNEKRKK